MSAPTPADAKRRALVRLPDGTVGRVTYVPVRLDERHSPAGRNRHPSQATVMVAGRHRHVRADSLVLVR